MIDNAIEIVTLFVGLLVPIIIITMYNVGVGQKLEKISDTINGFPSNMEVLDYNSKTDTLLFTIGSDKDIPPPEDFERIKEQLHDIDKCKLIIVPGCIHVSVLKNKKDTI